MNRLAVISLLLLALGLTNAGTGQPMCGQTVFGREELWRCAINVADRNFAGNNDGKISVNEMEIVFEHYVPWAARQLFKWVYGDLRDHLAECAPGPDQAVTRESFEAKRAQCFNDPGRLCKVKEFICDPAAAEFKKPVY